MSPRPSAKSPLRTVTATRYVTPLREGGSLPGLFEADDDGLYVVKLRGAGQGRKALVSELVGGELARAVGLPVPELVLVALDSALGKAEPDSEIRELLGASDGVNVGLDFLPSALDARPGLDADPAFAADVVWLDALITNVDRTPRNPNLLRWHGRTWLIDHGAALYLQHGPDGLDGQARRPFPRVADHVLLGAAGSIREADARLAPRLTHDVLRGVVELVPDDLLELDRDAYARYLSARLEAPRAFVEEAEAARGA